MRKQDEKLAELSDEIRTLTTKVAELRGERDANREVISLQDRVKTLQRSVSDLEVKKSKIEEDHARKLREVEHKVGLDRRRGEQEAELAKKDAVLAVREENLGHERKAFEEQMKFMRTRMEAEVTSLQTLMGQILERLPTVTVDKTITVGEPAA